MKEKTPEELAEHLQTWSIAKLLQRYEHVCAACDHYAGLPLDQIDAGLRDKFRMARELRAAIEAEAERRDREAGR